MIQDINTQLATLAAPHAIAATYSDVLDTLALDDYGMGNDWLWLVQVAEAFASAGAATLHIELVGNNTDPTFGAGTTVVIYDLGVIAVAALVLGFEARVKIPRVIPTPVIGANQFTGNYRYMAVRFTEAAFVMTAGKINSWIMQDATQDNRMQPAGYTVG